MEDTDILFGICDGIKDLESERDSLRVEVERLKERLEKSESAYAKVSELLDDAMDLAYDTLPGDEGATYVFPTLTQAWSEYQRIRLEQKRLFRDTTGTSSA
jgi:tetrahydromethanopterin S-methyltransferase subunit B